MGVGRVAAGRVLVGFVVALSAGLAVGVGTAAAHDPIIVTDRQVSPDDGPLLPDGTISFALYGTVHGDGDARGFRVRFADGDRLSMSLLIPALDPEQALPEEQLPKLVVVAPDGTSRDVLPTERVRFDESFSGTSYVRLASLDEKAAAGEYRVTVVGAAPARFTVSVGTEERFGTPVEQVDDRSLGVDGVQQWYATAPVAIVAAPVDTAVTTLPDTTVPASVVAAPATTPLGDTAPTESTAAAASATDADVTSSVPGGPPTTADDGPGGGGSAVFFGVMAVIVAAGVVLYLRRPRD